MKIAISAMEPDLDCEIEPRFGRSRHFILIDPETMQFETLENPNIEDSMGAGISTARLVCDKGVEAILTGRIGPKAQQVLSSAGVRMLTGASGRIRDVIQTFKAGKPVSETGSVAAPGMRRGFERERGRGMGPGRGLGRGMGGGGRKGMGKGLGRAGSERSFCYWEAEPWSGASSEAESRDEMALLRKQATLLSDELARIRNRIEQMERD